MNKIAAIVGLLLVAVVGYAHADTGRVKWFNINKGYGFIMPDNGSKDVFFHVTAIKGSDPKTIKEGEHVHYSKKTENKKTSAVDVTVIGAKAPDASKTAAKSGS